MRHTIRTIVDEALDRHCDDADLFREVIEELVHATAQLMGQEGLRQISAIVENEKGKMHKIV